MMFEETVIVCVKPKSEVMFENMLFCQPDVCTGRIFISPGDVQEQAEDAQSAAYASLTKPRSSTTCWNRKEENKL